MSRISSGRYCCKSQEDFQEEILDLKRQLAQVKDERRTLKVKLRRSEENAARKEKIICHMIDPLKAHLTAKLTKSHTKVDPQIREGQHSNKSTSVSKIYHRSTSSRANRQSSAKSTEESKKCIHKSVSNEELSKTGMKKRCNSNVRALIDVLQSSKMSPPSSLHPYGRNDSVCENHPNNLILNEIMYDSFMRPHKTMGGNSQSMNHQTRTTTKKYGRRKLNERQKYSSDENNKDALSDPCAPSGNGNDSLSSTALAESQKLSVREVKRHSTGVQNKTVPPHDSGNGKRCHLNSVVHCENSMIGREKLTSALDEPTDAVRGDDLATGRHALGEYFHRLISDENERCKDDIIAAGNEPLESCWEMENKSSPSYLMGSIFRVDIKKKFCKAGHHTNVNSMKELHGNTDLLGYWGSPEETDESRMIGVEFSDHYIETDQKVMEHLLGVLSIADDLGQNKLEVDNFKGYECLKNNLLSDFNYFFQGKYLKNKNSLFPERYFPGNASNMIWNAIVDESFYPSDGLSCIFSSGMDLFDKIILFGFQPHENMG